MQNKALKTRFAPSPTGNMHFGNARTALFNYLIARHSSASFLIRIEDTDAARSSDDFAKSLIEDLHWLGLSWQEGPYFQAERGALYAQYYQALLEQDAAYPCYCSEELLAQKRKRQIKNHQAPRYDGSCAGLSEQERQTRQDEGSRPTLRFRVPAGVVIEFDDLVKGPQSFQSDTLGDFIIRRQDGSPSFMFCNVIDDALMDVTHALRGEDHLTNTPRQLLILQALTMEAPRYGHFPLIVGQDGSPLSKRNGSKSVDELRSLGYHPQAVVNYLAGLGHHFETPKLRDLASLAQDFQVAHINHSSAHFDEAQLRHLQKETLLEMSDDLFWSYVQDWCPQSDNIDRLKHFMRVFKNNIVLPQELQDWWIRLFEPKAYTTDALDVFTSAGAHYFAQAIATLKSQNSTEYEPFLRELKAQTQLKGKALFMPLRLALTHDSQGPELPVLMDLMGLETVIIRLEQAREHVTSI